MNIQSKHRKIQIAVIGSGETSDQEWQAAYEIGRLIGQMKGVLITGGKGGIMEAASKGASEWDATVVGILPGSDGSEANPYCSVVIPSGLGHVRNSLVVLAADVVIAVGGGAGTLSEMTFSWIYNKPIIAYGTFKGWSTKLAGQKLDHRGEKRIIHCKSIDELIENLRRLCNEMGHCTES